MIRDTVFDSVNWEGLRKIMMGDDMPHAFLIGYIINWIVGDGATQTQLCSPDSGAVSPKVLKLVERMLTRCIKGLRGLQYPARLRELQIRLCRATASNYSNSTVT